VLVKVGDPQGPYPSPFADIYRYMALIAVEGFDALPDYCGTLVGVFFAAGKGGPNVPRNKILDSQRRSISM
jgi:hypothetical protein